jgi:apolipoprotein N-acyltransferase
MLLTTIYAAVIIALLTYTMYVVNIKKTLRGRIFVWARFGFFLNLFTLLGIYTTIPLTSMVPVWLQYFSVSLTLLILAMFCGALYALVGFLDWKFKKQPDLHLLSVAGSVVLVEAIRAYSIPLILWGEGSTLGFHFASWTLGTALAATPLVIFAYLGGTFMLSCITVLLVGIFIYSVSKKLRYITLSVLIISYMTLYTYADKRMPLTDISVGIIQTTFTHEITTIKNQKGKLKEKLSELSEYKPDIIIVPEGTRLLFGLKKEELTNITKLFPTTLFLDEGTTINELGKVNLSIIYNTQAQEATAHSKGYLFPFGEYVPYIMDIPSIFSDQYKDNVSAYRTIYEYVSGPEPRSVPTKYGKLGILICSELTSFSSIEALKETSPDIIIGQSSLSWFHNKPLFQINYILSLKLVAGMTLRPVISVANNAPTVVINSRGKVLYFEETSTQSHLFKVQDKNIQRIY